MPRYENPGSIVTDFEAIAAKEYSSIVLEDPASKHSGRWLGGLVTVTKTIHDVSPYGGSLTEAPLFPWVSDATWKFKVIGAVMWSNITWASASPTLRLGMGITTGVLVDWNPPSGSLAFRGDLNSHYNGSFLRGLILTNDVFLRFNAVSSGALTGALSCGLWGYIIPDLEEASS